MARATARRAGIRNGLTLRAFAETRLHEKKTWPEPDLDWVPLSRAIFTFELGEDGKWRPISDGLLSRWAEVLALKSGAPFAKFMPSSIVEVHYLEDGQEHFEGTFWELLEGKAKNHVSSR